MKKIVVLMLALCLAVPAISYAGNATSRFDLNIGGNIKVDMGWSDQTNGTLSAGGTLVRRDPRNDDQDVDKKYGVQLWGAGETGLNFLVRGPDAWGAKTSAFVAMDFVGFWGGSGYNTADLVIATINMDWANTSFSLGQSGQVWGKLPTWASQVAWAGQNLATKGSAPNLVNAIWTQRWTKELSTKFGVSSVSSNNAANVFPVSAATSFNRADIPLFQGAINWSSPACGKIGPWQLTFGTAGVWGQEKVAYNSNAIGLPNYDDDKVDMYVADFKFLVPIIPEKNGNKTGALLADGAVSYSQNGGAFIGPISGAGGVNLRYNRGTATNPDWAAPVITGYAFHVGYYFTDALYINGYGGYANIAASAQVKQRFPNLPENTYQYAFSLVYDVNPALRLAAQYDFTKTSYDEGIVQNGISYKSTGSNSNYRLAAYYFF